MGRTRQRPHLSPCPSLTRPPKVLLRLGVFSLRACSVSSCLSPMTTINHRRNKASQKIASDFASLRRLLIIDVVHAISMWIYLYGVSIVHPGDTLARTGAPELGALVTVFSMELLSSSLVQLFFSHRVYMLSRRLVIAVLGCVRASVKLARLLIIFILLGPQTDAGVLQNPVLVVMPAFAAVAVVEVFNTVTLCVVLRSRRAQIRRTKKVIDKLMLWSIQTGLLISICSILVVLLLVFSPRTEIWAVPFAILPKLFSLSLLSSLNSRAHIRRAMENTPVTFSILDSEPVAGVVPTGPPILLELPNRGRNAADADDAAKFPPQDLENNVGLGQQH